jgi:hypothetical protein
MQLPFVFEVFFFWWSLTAETMTKTSSKAAWGTLISTCCIGIIISPDYSLMAGMWIYAIGAISCYLMFRYIKFAFVFIATCSLGLFVGLLIRAVFAAVISGAFR